MDDDDEPEMGSRDGHETLLPSLTLSVLGGLAALEEGLQPLPRGMTPLPLDPPPLGPPPAGPPPIALRRAALGTEAPVAPPAITPDAPDAAKAEPAEPPRTRAARTNDVIGGRYIVEGQLGRGGMGRVMRVRHQVLGKAFALKLIKAPIATDPRIREMFYREARLASALTHEHICSIVDFGQDPSFGLFMVMELLDGQTAHSKLRQGGRMAPKVACDIMWQVCDAVRFIHGRAIIHGDIKSENIFLVRTTGARRIAKVLDFGLARPDLGRGTGTIDGTPEYLAPERIAGGASASAATDIYALGIVFYELLVGRLPFTGDMETVFKKHLDEPVPVPSTMIDEPLDERADQIVARATAKNPAERHPDVAGLMYELRTLMNMLGMETGRRRGGAGGEGRERRELDHRGKAAIEVFGAAPLPMASCDPAGKVRIANQAFLDFLGCAGDAAGIELRDSGLLEVCPTLLTDLAAVSTKRTSVKRVLQLSEGGGALVEAAIVMSPAPSTSEVTAGEVHILLHPLRHVAPT
ncbi:MAG: serine/threonine protein kinase [Deltaproteobacteria bacterium]|nr:serine/threonine protein kinase [Deltaproteobacteria bacterium]